MTQQILEWNSSTQYDTGTVTSFDLDDRGNCLQVHVGAGKQYYRVGTINQGDRSIDFGESTYYADGKFNSVSLAQDGNFVEVHVSEGRLYSRVARANFNRKTVDWREGRQYDQYDSGTFCDVAVDNRDNCLEVHVYNSNLYYRVGRVNYRAKNIDWTREGTLFSRGEYLNCSIAIDNQGNCIATHTDRYFRLCYRVGKLNGDTVNWGQSSQYAWGYLSSVALDEAGNCISTYVINNCLYYCAGTLNSESKTITWGENICYSEDNRAIYSFTNVASDSQGNCWQTHVVAGSPNLLFYRSTKLNGKGEWQQQFGSAISDAYAEKAQETADEAAEETTPAVLNLEWGSSVQYDTGTVSSFDLDEQGNCLEVHVGAGRQYYRVGTIDDDKSINFGNSTFYAWGNVNNIDLAQDGKFVEVHVSGGQLYSRVARANFSRKTVEWREGRQYDEYGFGTYCDVAVDERDNCLEIHIDGTNFYYQVGKIDYVNKSIDWITTDTLSGDECYENCSVALDNQGNCIATYSSYSNCLYYSVGRLNGDTVDWGEKNQYAEGYLSSVDLDEAGNCIVTYIKHEQLYYCLGKLNSESKTVVWGESILDSEGSDSKFSFTNVALDTQGNYFQVNVIPGSPNRLFYRRGELKEAQTEQHSKNLPQTVSGITANGLTIDVNHNIYATGTTLTQIGSSSFGKADAWVAKFDSEANQEWIEQLGTEAWDASKDITTDSEGYVYITGYTCGNMAAEEAQESDAWVMKLDSVGNEIWRKQFGSSNHDVSNAVAVDNEGNVYLAGYTLDSLTGKKSTSQASAWLAKLDSQGETIWLRELGTWGWTEANDIAIGKDNAVYLAGSTNSNLLALSDAWLAKYDPQGNQKWVKHFCRDGESAANAIAVDRQDNIYIAGYIKDGTGELISGWADVYVAKYDSNGNQKWFKSFGGASEVDDAAHDLTLDSRGNIYVAGHTESNLGTTNNGDNDAWVAKFKPDGDRQWIKQIGTSGNDYAFAIAVSQEQDVYLTGKTTGDISEINAGNYDVWLARVNP